MVQKAVKHRLDVRMGENYQPQPISRISSINSISEFISVFYSCQDVDVHPDSSCRIILELCHLSLRWCNIPCMELATQILRNIPFKAVSTVFWQIGHLSLFPYVHKERNPMRLGVYNSSCTTVSACNYITYMYTLMDCS